MEVSKNQEMRDKDSREDEGEGKGGKRKEGQRDIKEVEAKFGKT